MLNSPQYYYPSDVTALTGVLVAQTSTCYALAQVSNYVALAVPIGTTSLAQVNLDARGQVRLTWPLVEFEAALIAYARSLVVTTPSTTPVNSVAPVITGATLVGSTLSSTRGTWTSASPDAIYSYAWTRAGTAIPGAVGTTYVTVAADLGVLIRCVVTATTALAVVAGTASNAITPT